MHTENAESPQVTSPASSPSSSTVSPRKLAANRANAKRSTGPRTADGKAKSAMNAVRHGLASRAALLDGEDPAELEQLARELDADLRPRGALQRELVGRIVGIAWRLRRLARAEERLLADDYDDRVRSHDQTRRFRNDFGIAGTMFDTHLDPPARMSGAELVARQFEQSKTSSLERFAVYEQRLERSMNAAIRQLMQLRKSCGEDEPDDEAVDDEPTVETPIVQNEPIEARVAGSLQRPGGPPTTHTTDFKILQNEPSAEPHPAATTDHEIRQNEPTGGENALKPPAAATPSTACA
jgi:hypothetical protein